MRSYAPGFIFTTALPPAVCAAATAAIRHLKTSQWERDRHQERAARVKAVLTAAGLPVMPSDTHIVPMLVGDPEKCKAASDLLLAEHGIYIQPINYPDRAARHRAAAHHAVALSRRRADRCAGRSAGRCVGAAAICRTAAGTGRRIAVSPRTDAWAASAPGTLRRLFARHQTRRAAKRATSGVVNDTKKMRAR